MHHKHAGRHIGIQPGQLIGTAGITVAPMSDQQQVAEMGDILKKEGIDCDWQQGGYVSLARNEAQLVRSRNEVAGWNSWGFGDDHVRLLDKKEASRRANATRVLGGTFTPNCAAVHPAKLVVGLARVVEKRLAL